MSEVEETFGRALLIGAATGGLRGVEASVARFEEYLASRGIAATKLVTENASRDAVLDALEQVAKELGRDEPFVFYYAGHGHLWFPPDEQAPQVILVLRGTHASTQREFLGLLGPELSEKLNVISDATRNITTVFDCCHSGGIIECHGSREVSSGALEQLRRQAGHAISVKAGRRGAKVGLGTVVRIVATSKHERAGGLGGARDAVGLLTHTLVDVLEDHPDEPWLAVMARVRARVHARRRSQRPDVQGPWQRLPFSLHESSISPDLQPCLPVPKMWALQGPALLVAQAGDIYRLLSFSDGSFSADARVVEVQAQHVLLRIAEAPVRVLHGEELLWARPCRPHTPYLVRIQSDPRVSKSVVAHLRDAVDSCVYELIEDVCDGRRPIATLLCEASRVRVCDYLGDPIAELPVRSPWAELEAWLSRAAAFWRCVDNLRYDEALNEAFTLRWGIDGSGESLAIESSSAPCVASGSDLWFEIYNTGQFYLNLYVTAYLVDENRRFHSMCGPLATGVQLRADTRFRFSHHVRARRVVHEGVILVISSHPLAMHVLADQGQNSSSFKRRSPYGRAKPARSTVFCLYRVDPMDGAHAPSD